MIKRTIKVEYLRRRKDSKIGLTNEDLAEAGQKPWEVDAVDLAETFTLFTNRGKVSKTQASAYEIVNEEAERKLAELLEVESQRKADEKRAKELAKKINHYFKDNNLSSDEIEWDTVNNGSFSDDKTPGWVTIKTKTSHSNWYQGAGELHSPSLYHTQVPATVEQEARELQAIRRKHQNDFKFDFFGTEYAKRIIREADHENY
ncbi:hypothetical protein [Limosilactobacillus fermentum]|uniref:hypothetical protein n=1 Tax=Limosilactobacillus fermentum TaxID=1613 RepID=UPI0027BAB8B3|nr:hypothetical protein [Limosilactobacillus fermentum]WLW45150.1 hypothetical protein RA155_03540 [Limosilactobacillus fermentum]